MSIYSIIKKIWPVFHLLAILPSSGAISFGNENLTTAGQGTFDPLVVDTTTLTSNLSGYADKVGIGTANQISVVDDGGRVILSTSPDIGTNATPEFADVNLTKLDERS